MKSIQILVLLITLGFVNVQAQKVIKIEESKAYAFPSGEGQKLLSIQVVNGKTIVKRLGKLAANASNPVEFMGEIKMTMGDKKAFFESKKEMFFIPYNGSAIVKIGRDQMSWECNCGNCTWSACTSSGTCSTCFPTVVRISPPNKKFELIGSGVIITADSGTITMN
jgi:hypothetical protein